MNFKIFSNVFYEISEDAKRFYSSMQNVQLVNGGASLFPTNDKWITDNVLPDNIGDNISKLNEYYNEMTSLYWIWKNYKLPDYAGLCHYRLFFQNIPSEDFDICVAKPIELWMRNPNNNYKIELCSIKKAYKICHVDWCWDLFENHMLNYENFNMFMKWKN